MIGKKGRKMFGCGGFSASVFFLLSFGVGFLKWPGVQG